MDYDESYKDLSELKTELEGMRNKNVTPSELSGAVQKLSQTVTDMLEVFGAAVEQMKIEERQYESEKKKQDALYAKLDKLIEQNRTIAEGMVAIVDMVKGRTNESKRIERREKFQRSERDFRKPQEQVQLQQPMQPSSSPFMQPAQTNTQSFIQPVQQVQPQPMQQVSNPFAPAQQFASQAQQSSPVQNPFMQMQPPESQKPVQFSAPGIPSNFDLDLPPMESDQLPGDDFSDVDVILDEGAKKKGLFGIFKK